MVGKNIQEHPLASRFDIAAPSSKDLDLTDAVATRCFIKDFKPDFVIHAAGLVGGIQANISNPVDFFVTNVDLGRNVIIASYMAGVPKLLNLASSCIYPRHASNPLSESQILKGELEPTNEGYALAKIYAIRLCEYINRECDAKGNPGIRYKTLIPCNLYGLHDKYSQKHSHLIPAIIHKIHQAKTAGLREVVIWGDGNVRREFMYAGDLADGALKYLQDFEQLPDLMNIGLGFDYSINEYYAAVASVIGWEGHFIHDLSKPVGMKQKLVDITRQSSWGWASVTPLLEGIDKVYQSYLLGEYHEL